MRLSFFRLLKSASLAIYNSFCGTSSPIEFAQIKEATKDLYKTQPEPYNRFKKRLEVALSALCGGTTAVYRAVTLELVKAYGGQDYFKANLSTELDQLLGIIGEEPIDLQKILDEMERTSTNHPNYRILDKLFLAKSERGAAVLQELKDGKLDERIKSSLSQYIEWENNVKSADI